MSAIQTYVIRCDGEGCTLAFRVDSLKRATEIRAAAAIEGWRHALVDRGQGPASSYDFCPRCTVPTEAMEQARPVLIGTIEAEWLRLMVSGMLRNNECTRRDLAMAALGQLDRGLT